MPKESSKIINICSAISKYSIYSLVFLLPIFFLPWTADFLDFNKQALLIVLSFFAIFAWMIKSLALGKISFRFTPVHILIAVLFLFFLVSTIFSLWPYGSFWGWPQITSDSLLTFIGFLLVYFLITNSFSRKEIFSSIILLMTSCFLALFYGILQLFKVFILPLDYLKTTSFNTIGTINSLAIISAILLPLSIVFIINSSKKTLKLFSALVGILGLFSLVIINSPTAWWQVIIFSIVIISLGTRRGDIFDNRWLVLPMIFLAVAIFFIFLKIKIPNSPSLPAEVYLSQKTSVDISLKALKERPILGSGLGTFIYDFSKYKNVNFNSSSFWNVRFGTAGSNIINIFATTGILGGLSFLSLIGFLIFFGAKHFLKETTVKTKNRQMQNIEGKEKNLSADVEKNEKSVQLLKMGIFVSFVSLLAGYFLYSSNITLNFIFFLLLSCFVAELPAVKKDFILKPSSLITLGSTFLFTLIFIFGLGLFIMEGQRYAADVYYSKGINAWNAGKIDDAVKYLESALKTNPKTDEYWRELSQIYLQKINSEATRKDISQEELNQKIQTLISSAVNSAKASTTASPQNVANWSVLGFTYQNLIGVVGETKDWALKSYDEALKLEPANPYFYTQKGVSILKQASSLSGEEKNKALLEARNEFDKAVGLKSDYAPARFQIAMIYQAQGKLSEAITELEETKKIAPFDAGLAFQLGLVYYQNKDYQKAKAEFERAIVYSPNYSNALYFLGLTYDKLGDKAKAIDKFEKVYELNPNAEELLKIIKNLRGNKSALEGIGQSQPPEAPIKESQPEGAKP